MYQLILKEKLIQNQISYNYLDTEFITTSPNSYKFIQVAIYDHKSKTLFDYRLNPKLNGWDKKYIKRACDGKYGQDKIEPFMQLQKIIDGQAQENYSKQFNLSHVIKEISLDEFIHMYRLDKFYVWDKSSDKYLFGTNNDNLIDLQVMWIEKFGTQTSLKKAYLHVLQALCLKDDLDVIENLHVASFDAYVLSIIHDFMLDYDGKLEELPIDFETYERRINGCKCEIEHLKGRIDNLDVLLETSEITQEKFDDKLKRFTNYIAKKEHQITQIIQDGYFTKPWWK